MSEEKRVADYLVKARVEAAKDTPLENTWNGQQFVDVGYAYVNSKGYINVTLLCEPYAWRQSDQPRRLILVPTHPHAKKHQETPRSTQPAPPTEAPNDPAAAGGTPPDAKTTGILGIPIPPRKFNRRYRTKG